MMQSAPCFHAYPTFIMRDGINEAKDPEESLRHQQLTAQRLFVSSVINLYNLLELNDRRLFMMSSMSRNAHFFMMFNRNMFV